MYLERLRHQARAPQRFRNSSTISSRVLLEHWTTDRVDGLPRLCKIGKSEVHDATQSRPRPWLWPLLFFADYLSSPRNVSTTLRHPQAAFSEPRSVKDGA